MNTKVLIFLIAGAFAIVLFLFAPLSTQESSSLSSDQEIGSSISSVEIEYTSSSAISSSVSSQSVQERSKENVLYFTQDTKNRYAVVVVADDPAYEPPTYGVDNVVLIEGSIRGAGKYMVKVPKNIRDYTDFTLKVIDIASKKEVAVFEGELFDDEMFDPKKRIELDIDPLEPANSKPKATRKESLLPVL